MVHQLRRRRRNACEWAIRGVKNGFGRERERREEKKSVVIQDDWLRRCQLRYGVKGPSGKTIGLSRLYAESVLFSLALLFIVIVMMIGGSKTEDFRCRHRRRHWRRQLHYSLWQSLHRSMAHLIPRSGTPKGLACSCRSGTMRKRCFGEREKKRTHPSSLGRHGRNLSIFFKHFFPFPER